MNPTGSFTTLDDWLPWLETLSPREIDLGLDRVCQVLDVLGLPRADHVIHVAGTNGKGSSVAMIDALLAGEGLRTACYTSPHLVRYNERIRIAGEPASDEDIISAFKIVQAARRDMPLTYFEFGTLAALVAFADAGAEVLILEVGMGGRLDAVNAVEPDACLITNIAVDHVAWLGHDIESIAMEKAGIMRASKPVVFGAADCPRSIPEHAAAIGADLRLAERDFSYAVTPGSAGGWSWRGSEQQLDGLESPSLRGNVQMQNAASVLALLETMGFGQVLSTEKVNQAFGALVLDGRQQIVAGRPAWLLDVAHNPAAAAELAESLQTLGHDGPLTAVVGMLADKDVAGIIAPLRGFVDSFIAVTVPGARAAPAADLGRDIANASNKSCQVVEGIPLALQTAAERATPDGLVLVTGSFYVVGPALEWLQHS